MATTLNVVWAMKVRASHTQNHTQVSMARCSLPCRIAENIITQDHQAKQAK